MDRCTPPFTHWLAWNLPSRLDGVPEGVEVAPLGGVEGTNDYGDVGYGGPRPPSGVHRYFFLVLALDAPLALERGARVDRFWGVVEGHVVAWGETMGTYQADAR